MDEDQQTRSRERVQILAEVVGLPLGDERVPALAEAFDGARLMIAQLEPLAKRVNLPVGAPYDASWGEEPVR